MLLQVGCDPCARVDRGSKGQALWESVCFSRVGARSAHVLPVGDSGKQNIQYCMGDIIFLDGAQLVMVLCAVSTAGYCQLLVELLDNVGQVRSKAWRCKRNRHDMYILDVRRHSVVFAACWIFEDDERILVLE